MNKGVEIRTFSTGTANLGDSLYFALTYGHLSHEDFCKKLREIIPPNDTAIKLLEDIRSHKCNRPDIISDDDKVKCLIAFRCKGCKTQWQIPLAELKACCVHHPELKDQFITTESRKELAKRLTKEIKP